jgi:hypothetical protein
MQKNFIVFLGIIAVSSALSGCKTHQSVQENGLDSAFQANFEAETQIEQAGKEYRKALGDVLVAIENIADQQRKAVAKEIFDQNQQAWNALIESESLLRQGAKSATETSDIRYRRIADAERTWMRVDQLHDFADWIRMRFK